MASNAELRAAFVEGAIQGNRLATCTVDRELAIAVARLMYPNTKPREVMMSNGYEYRVAKGVLEYRALGGVSWRMSVNNVADLQLFKQLADNPTEEVTE